MAAGSRHGRGADQVSLRLPDGMRDRIKAAADANNRSMNAEIIATLEDAYGSENEVVTRSKTYGAKFSSDELLEFLQGIRDDIAEIKDKTKG